MPRHSPLEAFNIPTLEPFYDCLRASQHPFPPLIVPQRPGQGKCQRARGDQSSPAEETTLVLSFVNKDLIHLHRLCCAIHFKWHGRRPVYQDQHTTLLLWLFSIYITLDLQVLNNNSFITSSNYSLMENSRSCHEFTDLHFGDTLGRFQQHAQVPVVKYFNEKTFGIYIYFFPWHL